MPGAKLLLIGCVVLALAAACAPAAPSTPGGPAAASPPAPSGAATAEAPQAARPAAAPAPTPRRGGTLVYAASADVENMDPALRGGTISGAVKSLLYSSLVKEMPDLTIQPDLATSWKNDGTSWTFELRTNVKFHDGTPFNAQAVKVHFDRVLGPENLQRASDWRSYLDRVEVVDDSTVRFVTRFPDAYFLSRLANSSQIASPEAIRKLGKDIARNPVGAGPFKLKERIPDVRVVVTRFDDYWGDKAYLDEVVIRPIAEAGARAIALESGEVQLAALISPEHMDRLSRNPNLALDPVATTRQLTLGMNLTHKPFDDPRVRQALNYALDRHTIARSVYNGLAEVLPSGVPKRAEGYGDLEEYPYDPARARELLAQAGLANGFSTTLVTTRGRYFKDFELAQAVQQYFKAVGVEVKIEQVEWARYLELVNRPTQESTMQMWLDGWSGQRATDILEIRFGCEMFRPKGSNIHSYCNKQLDALVQQAQRELDPARRAAILKQAQELIRLDAPSVWGLATKVVAGMSKKLHGVLNYPSETLTVDEHTWLEP